MGYCTSAPNTGRLAKSKLSWSPTITSQPSASARVCTTAIVCGRQRSLTKNVARLPLVAEWHIAIASAAAVPSSSSDALESGSAVRSVTIVCQLSSASSRPWLISAW